jgi:hypothetical protein
VVFAAWPRGASGVRDFQLALAVSSIGETGTDVFFRQVGKFPQDLWMRHATGEIFEHVVHGDPEPSDAGFAASFSGFHGDDAGIAYGPTLLKERGCGKRKLKLAASIGARAVRVSHLGHGVRDVPSVPSAPSKAGVTIQVSR